MRVRWASECQDLATNWATKINMPHSRRVDESARSRGNNGERESAKDQEIRQLTSSLAGHWGLLVLLKPLVLLFMERMRKRRSEISLVIMNLISFCRVLLNTSKRCPDLLRGSLMVRQIHRHLVAKYRFFFCLTRLPQQIESNATRPNNDKIVYIRNKWPAEPLLYLVLLLCSLSMGSEFVC